MMSLRTRVTLSAALVLAVFIGLTALALDQAFKENARAAMRERLFARLYLVMAETEVDKSGQLQMPESLGEPRLNLPGSGLFALIAKADGQPLWQSPSAVGMNLAAPADQTIGEERFALQRLMEIDHFAASLAIEWETESGRHPLLFTVFETTAPFVSQLNQYRRSLWGWLGGMALLLILAQVLVLAWGLRPLRTVAREIKAIESGSQNGLKEVYPKELKRLTDNINTLLLQERAHQSRYKNALSDLAHSLKTPLAILRGLGSIRQTPEEQAETLEEQVARMDSIVQYQLQRAATAGRSALAPPLQVKPVAERLLSTLNKVYRDKNVEVTDAIAGNTTFRGDEGDLMELLGNLLDNAFKWCERSVKVTAGCHQGKLLITVEDDGTGIERNMADKVLQRGVRADETIPGHGIGLPMVRDIVEAYGGELSIERSELGGAAVEIRLIGC